MDRERQQHPEFRRNFAGEEDLPPELFSRLVGNIYDCVLNPGGWDAVLQDICDEFRFAGSLLGLIELPWGRTTFQAAAGFDPEWVARVPDYGPEIVAMWGGPERILQYPLDEPFVQSQTVGPESFNNRYGWEWGRPQGLIDQVAITIARDATVHGNVGFGRHESAGEIGDFEVRGLRLLAPHIRRAVTIGNLFNMKRIETETFASVLDGLAFGFLLVDGQLGIVHANRAAQAMLAAADPLRQHKGSLTVPQADSQAALLRAVLLARTDATALQARGIGIPARDLAGQPYVIHVLPVHSTQTWSGLVQRAVAALFIAPASAPAKLPMDAVALLYDLTPAEGRIFEMLAAGNSRLAMGQALGIAGSTVKTHVLHVLEKTGCKRQTDVVKLAARLSSPGA